VQHQCPFNPSGVPSRCFLGSGGVLGRRGDVGFGDRLIRSDRFSVTRLADFRRKSFRCGR
jgi:hypothetical protein